MQGEKMKRIIICISLITLILLTLTSCQVNWFGETKDVEWWVVAIPVVIMIVASLLIGRVTLSDREYDCPECQKTFTPGWKKIMFTVHSGSKRVLKCPHCGRKGFCKLHKD